SFIPFFNVALQGAAQPARMIRDNPKAALSTLVSLLAGPTVAAEAWNNSDPQRAKDYADVPNYYKDSGIVMMLPGPVPVDAQGNRKPNYVVIPTREFTPFVAMTRAIAGSVMGDAPQNWQSLLFGSLASMSPVPLDSASAALGQVMPGGPLLSTPIGLVTDHNFLTGNHIVSNAGDQNASTIAKGIAGGVNTVGNALGETTNLHPSQVDYALRNIAGGPGQILSSMRPQNNQSAGPQSIPVVGPMVNRLVKNATGQNLSNARSNIMTPQLQEELRNSGVTFNPGPAANHIGKLKLTQAEEAQYQEAENQLVDAAINRVVRIPQWQSLSKTEKQDIVTKVVTQAREEARGRILRGIGLDAIKQRMIAQQKAAAATASP
ncbi:MAG: hypothetical protein KGL39_05370, partial [Patescibacteria group bacterium]|nr:hypothetical protein [Patescibacteria group bacterium]